MSTKKFHLTPTGQARKCSAQTPETCKYSIEAGETVAHYETREEAQAAYEQQMEQSGESSTSSKIKKTVKEFLSDDVVEKPVEQKYYVTESNYDKAVSAMESANRKLANANIDGRFEYTLEEKVRTEMDNITWQEKYIPYYELIVTAPVVTQITENGEEYEFQAVIESVENGYITRSARGVELNGWKPKDLTCDHCGQKRTCNKTYVVKDPNGNRQQIGSSCVGAYLGVKPAGLWALGFDPAAKEFAEDDERAMSSAGNGYSGTRDVMALAMALTDNGKKFVSKNSAMNYGGTATADIMNFYLLDMKPSSKAEQDEKEEVLSNAAKLRNAENSELDKVMDRLKNIEGDSDYVSNLRTLSNGDFVRPKDVSLFISGLAALRAEEEKIQRREEAKKREELRMTEFTPGHMGQVGDKIEKGTVLKLYSTKDYTDYDYYGHAITKTVVTAKDSDGHQVSWFTTVDFDGMEPGDDIVISSGKVKKHGSFRNVDQTQLSNVRLMKNK